MRDYLAYFKSSVDGQTHYVHHICDAKGYCMDYIVWLREPTDDERAALLPALVHTGGLEINGYANE